MSKQHLTQFDCSYCETGHVCQGEEHVCRVCGAATACPECESFLGHMTECRTCRERRHAREEAKYGPREEPEEESAAPADSAGQARRTT